MRLLILLLLKLSLFTFYAFAANQQAYYCPEKINCPNEIGKPRCIAVDKESNVEWKLIIGGNGGGDYHGLYTFDWAMTQNLNLTCFYNGNTRDKPMVSVDFLVPAQTGQWKPPGKSLSKICRSTLSNDCPLIEAPILRLERDYKNSFSSANFCITDDNGPRNTSTLNLEELRKICGMTSNCIIDLGEYYWDHSTHQTHLEHFGVIDLDLSDQDHIKINKIDTDENSPFIFYKDQNWTIIHVEKKH